MKPETAIEAIIMKPETAVEAMKIGRVIGGYYELSEEGKRIVEEAMLAAVQARFAARELSAKVYEPMPRKQEREEGNRKGNRWYTHAQRQYLNDMFVRYKGHDETIVAAAKSLDRSVSAISRQWHEFVNHPHKWSEWIKGGKK